MARSRWRAGCESHAAYNVQAMKASFPIFRPHPLVRGGHAQTVLGAYLPHAARENGSVQHRIGLADGDQLVLHDDCPANWKPGNRSALLLHGLGGCHGSPYMLRLALKLNAAGVRAFRLDQRGCGAGFALAQHPGHAGRSEDARAALERIGELCPDSPVSMIGYSLGGNIALKLAGECGSDPPGHLDSALAVGPPIDLQYCCEHMKTGLNWIYDRTFIRALVALVKRRHRELPELHACAPLVPPPKWLIDFDNRYTAPLSGFADARDYYARCSSAPLLPNIRIPTQILTAADDPLIPVAMLRKAQRSSAVELHIADSGGHIGYFAKSGLDPDRRWLDWRLVEWVLAQA
jgi:predicted alpha/beta-fold hydrolase